jgi:predicted ATP-grasp superfamily ATP-dependent carboligase
MTAFDAAEYLAWSLHEAGASIEVLCPMGNAMPELPFVKKSYPYSNHLPLPSLHRAIAAAKPDLVIPCDDNIASQLHQLYETSTGDDALRQLLTVSLGNPDNFSLYHSRVDVCRLAREMDVACPETVPVIDKADFWRKLNMFGLPAVLKIDRSWGGNGVAIVRTAAEAERAFARLRGYPGLPRALKRLLRNGDARLMQQILGGRKNTLSLQRYVEGRRANAAVACWQGETLAAVTVEVLASDRPTGPATMVRVVADPVMSMAVRKMVERLKLSGLCGFDFIIPADGGAAQLLELNPRVTPTSHLVTADGQVLAMALCGRWRGDSSPPARRAANFDPLFTFPKGRRRAGAGLSPAAFLKNFWGGFFG